MCVCVYLWRSNAFISHCSIMRNYLMKHWMRSDVQVTCFGINFYIIYWTIDKVLLKNKYNKIVINTMFFISDRKLLNLLQTASQSESFTTVKTWTLRRFHFFCVSVDALTNKFTCQWKKKRIFQINRNQKQQIYHLMPWYFFKKIEHHESIMISLYAIKQKKEEICVSSLKWLNNKRHFLQWGYIINILTGQLKLFLVGEIITEYMYMFFPLL